MWMNLQAKYDLEAAEDAIGRKVEQEVLPRSAAVPHLSLYPLGPLGRGERPSSPAER